jgi:outer membrane protein assembly factor BamD (BamD/ComL family)
MTRRLLSIALLAALLALVSGCAIFGSKKVDETPAQMYERARELFREEQWEDAEDVFADVWEDHPGSPLAADARFYEAECRYGRGKYNGAYELYKRFLEQHPLSPHSPLIQRRLYDMGTYLIEEGKTGLFGMTYSGEGVEILDYLVSAFPHGDLADDALVYAADHEWRTEHPLRAIGHLHDLIDQYPGSEWALEARLRLARAYRDVNRGTKYDAEALKRSKAQYLAYIELVSSDSAREREYADLLALAREELALVVEELAQKMLDAADFYLRTGKVDAAQAELRNLVREHPGTRAADEAMRRLGRDVAVDLPEPVEEEE